MGPLLRGAAALLALGLAAGCSVPAGAAPRGDRPSDRAAGRTTDAERACRLVPAESIATEVGIGVVEGEPGGDRTRSTCSYPASGSGPGLTVGVSAAQRYDERVASAERSAGVTGTDVPDLGRHARFLFSTAQLRTGLGTLIVQDKDMTLDVTVQGLADAARARETATAVARTALRNR